MLCSNCEFAPATCRCTLCSGSDDGNLYCHPCGDIHLKIKKFREHKLEKYEALRNNRMCCNCDEVAAKFKCLECSDGSNWFCTGCSLLHPRVKASRNHRLVAADELSDHSMQMDRGSYIIEKAAIIRAIQGLFSFMCNTDIIGFFDELPANMKGVAGIGAIIVVFIVFLTMRQLLGRDGTSVLTLIFGALLMRWLHLKKSAAGGTVVIPGIFSSTGGTVAHAVPTIVSSSGSRTVAVGNKMGVSVGSRIPKVQLNSKRYSEFSSLNPGLGATRLSDDDEAGDGEFKDEFSYRRHSGPAKLRPRSGRKYEASKRQQSSTWSTTAGSGSISPVRPIQIPQGSSRNSFTAHDDSASSNSRSTLITLERLRHVAFQE